MQEVNKKIKKSVIKENRTGIFFNSDSLTIQGYYKDEISAFRAKEQWEKSLLENFDLEKDLDFKIHTNSSKLLNLFIIVASFKSSQGKYSYWKITKYQSPEIQYIFETAHIPLCESRHKDILIAPDLQSAFKYNHQMEKRYNKEYLKYSSSFKKWLDKLKST